MLDKVLSELKEGVNEGKRLGNLTLKYTRKKSILEELYKRTEFLDKIYSKVRIKDRSEEGLEKARKTRLWIY